MFDLVITSSLEKVLPKTVYAGSTKNEFSALEGETLSFQAVYSTDCQGIYGFKIEHDCETELESYFVKNVAVDYATHEKAWSDSNYISHQPGLYPDLLAPVDRDWVYANNICHSLWVSVKAKSGIHKIKITFTEENGDTAAEKEVTVNVINAALPEQRLIYTQWFHTDCIADSYGYPIFSEQLWEMAEKFLHTARENGINMILTPVFTPPLDTAVGSERPTVQLMKVKKNGQDYEFDFTLLHRWMALCKRLGFSYFEMPHLFTQWGAEFTPKIVAEENGEEKKIFGWHVKADSAEYDNFLSQYLPALIKYLKSEGIFENTYFHISDEPDTEKSQAYKNARSIAHKYLKGCKIIDAVSADYRIIQPDIPIQATDKIYDFTDYGSGERWCYYCNAQCVDVSNRFVVMPSARNRSIGVQLYKYRMMGFLHWGYNFYYSRFSLLKLDPFCENDAYGAFPSGDSVSVYPGKEGPMPAIGLVVFNEALQDLRAFELLEQSIGHEATVHFIENFLGDEITFKKCFSAQKLLGLREAVNERINSLVYCSNK